MICPKCKKKNKENAEKCRYCGEKLDRIWQPDLKWNLKTLAIIYSVLIVFYLIIGKLL